MTFKSEPTISFDFLWVLWFNHRTAKRRKLCRKVKCIIYVVFLCVRRFSFTPLGKRVVNKILGEWIHLRYLTIVRFLRTFLTHICDSNIWKMTNDSVLNTRVFCNLHFNSIDMIQCKMWIFLTIETKSKIRLNNLFVFREKFSSFVSVHYMSCVSWNPSFRDIFHNLCVPSMVSNQIFMQMLANFCPAKANFSFNRVRCQQSVINGCETMANLWIYRILE